MAEVKTVIEQGNGTGTEDQGKTFTQEEVNKLIQDRVSREKAKFADYDTLKEKAGKYDQTVNEGKTELQKATERAEKAERELNDWKEKESARTIRAKVAKEMGVPESALSGTDEETCKAQAQAMLDFFKPDSYPDVKDGGENKKSGKRTTAEEFADWFSKSL